MRLKPKLRLSLCENNHDANAIMLSDVGKDAPAGHCKQCWDRKKNEPKRKCRVFAEPTDGQSLACAFCRLKGNGGCDANPREEEKERGKFDYSCVRELGTSSEIGTRCCRHCCTPQSRGRT